MTRVFVALASGLHGYACKGMMHRALVEADLQDGVVRRWRAKPAATMRFCGLL